MDKETHMVRVISANLRSLMEEKGLSQTEFAHLMEVSDAQISHWLHGRRCPSWTSLSHICQRLGATPAQLLETEEDRERHRNEQKSAVKKEIEQKKITGAMKAFNNYFKATNAGAKKKIKRK